MDSLVQRVLQKMTHADAQDTDDSLANLNVEEASKPDPMLVGKATFRDTGRETGNLGEMFDSALGAPARAGIEQLQHGRLVDALRATASQIGKDPNTAPTGVDIALNATKNPYLGAGIATAVDLGAQLPIAELAAAGKALPGVIGSLRKENTAKSAAEKILAKINTPEKAVSLSGPEKAEYLQALDIVHGPRAERAKQLGFGDETYYHGTPKIDAPISEFKNSKAGGVTGKYGEGVYLTDAPEYADQFTWGNHNTPVDSGTIYPVKIKEKLPFHPADDKLAEKLLTEGKWVPEVSRPRMLRSTEEGLHLLEKNVGKKEITNVLNESGYRVNTSGDGGVGILTAAPNEIRSVNAAFDPRFSDSPLLLAAKTVGANSKEAAIGRAVEKLSPRVQEAYAELLKGGTPAVKGLTNEQLKQLEKLKSQGKIPASSGFNVTGVKGSK